MGGVNSCWLPRYQNPNLVHENHTSTPKRKGHRRNLSAAFNLAEMEREPVMEQLNINTATEEELMTLPGINRLTAHNIVEYRRQIGVFKKVEDLALVSRVGATKLNQIRLEICVGRKKSSTSSSRSSSRQDLSVTAPDAASKASSRSQVKGLYFIKVNVNTANVFQLMKVKDITQLIAQNIVAHRDRKGAFRHLDDLVKVKGINGAVLSAIRPHLVLNDAELPAPVVQQNSNGFSAHNRTQSYTDGYCSPPLSMSFCTGGSQDDLLNMYGPISRKSFRCKRAPPVFKRDGQPLIRVGTWNVEGLNEDKADNPGVKEVLCMTALEYGLSVVAFQGLSSDLALNKVCEEMEKPTLPNVKRWLGRRGCWRAVVSPDAAVKGQEAAHVGFFYDASQDIELVSSHLLRPQSELRDYCTAFIAHFKVRDQDVVLVNVEFRRSLDEINMQQLAAELNEYLADLDVENVFLLGDAYRNEPANVMMCIEKQGYECLQCGLTPITKPNERVQVLSKKSCCQLKTVKSGVITEGLTNPWIPDGWRWGGSVSPHAPLFCELMPTHHSSLEELGGGDS